MKNLLFIFIFLIGNCVYKKEHHLNNDHSIMETINKLLEEYNRLNDEYSKLSKEKIIALIKIIFNPNTKIGNKTLLGFCIKNGKDFGQLVIKLLKKGADPNEKSNNEYPIIIALKKYKSIETACQLAKYGADIYVEDEDGNTPLMIILSFSSWRKEYSSGCHHFTFNSDELKRFILETNVDINKPNSRGYLPLNEFINILKNSVKEIEVNAKHKDCKTKYYCNEIFYKKYPILSTLEDETNRKMQKTILKIKVLSDHRINPSIRDCNGTDAFDLLKNKEGNDKLIDCYITELIIMHLKNVSHFIKDEEYNISFSAYTDKWNDLIGKEVNEDMGSFLIQVAIIDRKYDILKSLRDSGAHINMNAIKNIKIILRMHQLWMYSSPVEIIKNIILNIKEEFINEFFLKFYEEFIEDSQFFELLKLDKKYGFYRKEFFLEKIINIFKLVGLDENYKNKDGITIEELLKIHNYSFHGDQLVSHLPNSSSELENNINLKSFEKLLEVSLEQNNYNFTEHFYEENHSNKKYETTFQFQEAKQNIKALAFYLFEGNKNRDYFKRHKFPNVIFAKDTFFRLILNSCKLDSFESELKELIKIMELFLEAGIDINEPHFYNFPPLVYLFKYSNNTRFEKPYDENYEFKQKEYPFYLNLCRFLIDNSDLTIRDNENNNLLMLAIKCICRGAKIVSYEKLEMGNLILKYLMKLDKFNLTETNINGECVLNLIFNEKIEESINLKEIQTELILNKNSRNIIEKYIVNKNLFLGSYYVLFNNIEKYRIDEGVLDLIIEIVKCAFSDDYYKKNKTEINKKIMEKI